MRILKARIKFEPRDLWIGVFWNYAKPWKGLANLKVFICIVPMLPLILDIETKGNKILDTQKE